MTSDVKGLCGETQQKSANVVKANGEKQCEWRNTSRFHVWSDVFSLCKNDKKNHIRAQLQGYIAACSFWDSVLDDKLPDSEIQAETS